MVLWAYSSVVEPPAHNRLVLGSNPSGPTMNEKSLLHVIVSGLFFCIQNIADRWMIPE